MSARNVILRHVFNILSARCIVLRRVFHSLSATNKILRRAFDDATTILPESQATPHKPWISQATLSLIERRMALRSNREFESEAALTKQIKESVKKDKTQWLETLAGTGNWDDIRFLRKKKKLKQGTSLKMSKIK